MPKPLRSDDPNPQPVQFRDFGVLNDGTRSRSATITSITVNVLIALMVLFLVKATVIPPKPPVKVAIVDPLEPVKPPPPPPPPPKLPPPPKMPPPPPVKVPVPPTPEPPKPTPTPPVTKPEPVKTTPNPPAPKKVDPPPAPKNIDIKVAAASVPNHDARPSPVRLGTPDNPLKPLTGPAVAPVNMGVAGMPGMNKSNSGSGPRSVGINMGSGSPNGSNMAGTDRGAQPIAGIKGGVPGGTGSGRNNYPTGPAQIRVANTPVPTAVPAVNNKPMASSRPPTVIYQPKPVYTAEATEKHIQGNVTVRIHVAANGAVEVLSVVHGLGYGLDQAAMTAARGIRFKPAIDSNGNPVDWTGNVLVEFLLA